MIKDKVKDLFIGYCGIIEDNEKGMKITSKNRLNDNKEVECEVGFGYLKSKKYPYCVDACEKTYCIIGGRGYPCENEDEVLKILERNLEDYKFKKKEFVQLSLFDL